MRVSGELMVEGRVKDKAGTGGVKREACSDKNSSREPEILIIQDGESLIFDHCPRL